MVFSFFSFFFWLNSIYVVSRSYTFVLPVRVFNVYPSVCMFISTYHHALLCFRTPCVYTPMSISLCLYVCVYEVIRLHLSLHTHPFHSLLSIALLFWPFLVLGL